MIYLIRIRESGPQWPYSFQRLRIDEPQLSISYDPHAGEIASWLTLDPPIIIIKPQVTEPPAHDPATHKAVEVMPVEIDGQWQQAWELQELPPPPIVPRWVDFSAVIMALPAANAMLGAVLQAAPGLYGGMVVGLQQASEGDSRVFLNSWNAALALGLISAELIVAVQEIAAEYDLPEAFIEALAPAA